MSFWVNLGSDIHRTYFIISLIAGGLGLYLAIILFFRMLKRKNLVTFLVFAAITCLSIAIILDPIFLAYRTLTGKDFISLQGILSFGITGIANIFLLFFLHEVFFSKGRMIMLSPVLAIEALILPLGISMYFQQIDTLPILAVHLLVSFGIYLSQFLFSLKLRQRIKDETPNDKISFIGTTYIGISGILMFFTYITFLLQELGSLFGDLYDSLGIIQNGATIFIPIGFVLSGISAFCLYIGFVIPEWVRKRVVKS